MANKPPTLADLIRIAIAKHGENRAYILASRHGKRTHKRSWQLAIAEPVQTIEEKLDEQIWQDKLKAKFKHDWDNGLKQQFENKKQ